jgi:hypothetical protein
LDCYHTLVAFHGLRLFWTRGTKKIRYRKEEEEHTRVRKKILESRNVKISREIQVFT